jgi:hypothetical protein
MNGDLADMVLLCENANYSLKNLLQHTKCLTSGQNDKPFELFVDVYSSAKCKMREYKQCVCPWCEATRRSIYLSKQIQDMKSKYAEIV